MASVALVVPSWHYWIDPIKLQPLWELYYATLLSERLPEAVVDLIDLRKAPGDDAEIPLPERDVYVYWIMKSADAFELYDIRAKLSQAYPRSKHIAGGTHVDHMPDQCAEHFDVILSGTAEDTLTQAVKDALAGHPLAPRPPAQARNQFCSFSHARRDFIPTDRVVNDKHFQMYGGVPGTGVYFSRGCAFRCNFCVYNNPGKFEYRTPDQIRAEIAYLKSTYGVQGVNLRDEVCLPVKRSEAIPYIEAIGESDVIWRGQTVPMGDEDIVALAAQSGLKEVALGLESVDSDAVLVLANKPSKSIDNNRRYIEVLKKHGIKVKVCLIFGLPGESQQVLDNTIAFLEDTQPDFVAVSGFDPVPGSPFYRNPQDHGIAHIDDDLTKHAHLLYRFGEKEDVGLPFDYAEETSWGTPLTRAEIQSNIMNIQSYLRERGMSY
ncbi:B12-binding domain-containing radical SAM protein [Rhodospirillum sp. A1_3_36]|uniref:B12-binding domain-containing radical SAM protein n=1 Tax=Rhodospirillum sp. A1_3_36 TaxID=3391666 RepID=UPI0039A70DA9